MQNTETKGTVLIVDDQLDNLRLLTNLLVDNRYSVRAAKTGKEALLSITSSLPDLVLLDIRLPDINGYDVCTQIKRNPKTCNIPVIFLSSLKESEDILKAIEIGGVDYISKPYKTAEVISRVKTHVEINKTRLSVQQKNEEIEAQNEMFNKLNEELIQTNMALFELQKTTKEARDRFELLFKLNPDAVTITQISNGIITDANEGLSKLFGYTPKEVIGKSTLEINIWPTQQDRQRFVTAITEKGQLSDFECELCRKDGTLFSALVSTTIIDHNGIPHILCVTRNITEQKKAEKELKDRNQFIESLINISPEILYIYDVIEGKNIFSNDRIQSILGFSTEEVHEMGNQFIPTLMHPDDLLIYINKILPLYSTAKDNEQISHSYRMKRKTGEWRWIESIEIIYKRQPNGLPQQIFGVGHDITVRKNIEEALKENEIKYSTLFNEMLEGFALHEIICNEAGEPVDYKFLRMNPAYEKLTGLQSKAIVGKTVKEIMPQIEPFWIENYGKVALTGQPFTFENYTKELDSYFRVNAFSHQKGQFAVLFENITDRKRSEVAQMELNKTLSLLNQLVYSSLESASVGAWWIDFSEKDTIHALDITLKILEGPINKSKKNTYKLTDWIKLLQETAITNPEYEAQIEETLEKFEGTVSGKYKTYRTVYPVITPLGHTKWIDARANVSERDSSGRALYMTGTLIDITERKQAEELIAAQERFLRALTDNIPGMVAYWTKDLICLYSNSAYLEWFGKTNQEMIGINMLELKGGTLFEKNKPYIDKALQGEKVDFERTLVKANGEIGYTWAHYIPDIKDNEVIGFYVLVSDITSIKNAEIQIQKQNEALIELNATKDKFFSIIAHDLKGPLGNLCQINQLIVDNFDIYDKDKILKFTTMCNSEANKTFYLLENLLEWSLLQRGKLKPNPKQCNISDLATEITSFFDERSKSKNIRLLNNTNSNITAICDEDITKTILRNLVSNAIKFVNEGGSVTISTIERDAFIEFQIQDTGKGIPPEVIPNLFSIALNKSTIGTDDERGTGLGLPLCKELAEKQGGQIWVESELGKGSTFSFSLKKLL